MPKSRDHSTNFTRATRATRSTNCLTASPSPTPTSRATLSFSQARASSSSRATRAARSSDRPPPSSRARALPGGPSWKSARPSERSAPRRSFCSTTARTARRFGCYFASLPCSAATAAPSFTSSLFRSRFTKRTAPASGISASGAAGRKCALIRYRSLVACVPWSKCWNVMSLVGLFICFCVLPFSFSVESFVLNIASPTLRIVGCTSKNDFRTRHRYACFCSCFFS